MPLFGKKKSPAAEVSAYEAPPLEHGRGRSAPVPAPQQPTRLTPEEVHDAKFGKPPMGKRGYNEDEVDAFLDLIEDTLSRPPTPGRGLSAEDVDGIAFSKPAIGKRGYNEKDVDAFLDRAAAELRRRLIDADG